MRFLLDVNVGAMIARTLAELGHDVVRAGSYDPRMEDPDLLAFAVQERRILITYDRDFSELIFNARSATPPGIIYLRYQAEEIADVVQRIIPLLDFSLLNDHMTVVDQRRIRRTPLPAGPRNNG